ncbi:hypothetical protein ACFY2R_30040, partial [Micromonospora olivasterospora]|uniref:hypothetical protein n=1 Tax=Micromonospora olivasterospora TaxID=1880 RepID=UPI00369BC4B6
MAGGLAEQVGDGGGPTVPVERGHPGAGCEQVPQPRITYRIVRLGPVDGAGQQRVPHPDPRRPGSLWLAVEGEHVLR